MEKKHYVYAYLDPRKIGKYEYEFGNKGILRSRYEIIYIGKGCGKRSKFHLDLKKCTNKHLKAKIIAIRKECSRDPIIKFVKKNLDENRAFSLEQKLIDGVGRIFLKEGPLVNFSNGEHGVLGSEGMKELWKNGEFRKKMLKNRSEKRKEEWEDPSYREKQFISRKKAWRNPETKEKRRKGISLARKKEWADPIMRKKRLRALEKTWKANEGRPMTEDNKEKLRISRIGMPPPMKGKRHSEEAKKKISEATKGENNPFFGKRHSEETKRKMKEAALKC